MKTSKKIFVTLLISIAVLIIAAFVDIRIHGRRIGTGSSEIITKNELTAPFKVISAVNSRNLKIVDDDSSYIEIAWYKDSIPPKINYKILNDTLIISDMKYLIRSTGYQPVKIHATNSLTAIKLKDSEVSLGNTGSGILSVDLDNSSAWFSQNKSKIQYFSNLSIIAKNNSTANSNDFNVDTLRVFLQNSQSNLQIRAKKIYGTLTDSSTIGFQQTNEIYLKADSTSTIRIY